MKIKFKFSSLIILSLVAVSFVFTFKIQAFNLSPSTGFYSTGSDVTVSLTADPPANAAAVQIRLTLTGGATITNYTAPTDVTWAPALGSCSGSTMFTATQVCVDIAKTGINTVTNGESLGTFTFHTTSAGVITITKDSNNGYIVSSSLDPDLGTPASYNVTGLPNTALGDSSSGITIAASLLLILVGFTLYFQLKSRNQLNE